MSAEGKRSFGNVRRVVVKLGSHVVTRAGYRLNRQLFDALADDIKWLHSKGVEVAIVSSGAVAAGMGRLKLATPPQTIPEKQAVASVGQIKLMRTYKERFRRVGLTVGQVLLTRDDFESRRRYQNAKNTITTLFSMGIVPVINENDTVVVDEMKFGDNDNLSAMVANLVEADCLIILSDVAGLFDKDPKANDDATLITRVEKVDDAIADCVGESCSAVGTGGMGTKLQAASRAVHGGIDSVIACGEELHMLRRVMKGDVVGTHFPAMEDRLTRRKHWIAYTVKAAGSILVDEGAVRALTGKGRSLLPKGIVEVRGEFERGDAVSIETTAGVRIAKGLTNYSSDEVAAIVGLASTQIVDRLGYKFQDEVVHRDDLVVLNP